jgi:hypothetical protein
MLTTDSILWAIDFVSRHSNSDLSPKIQGFKAIKNRAEELASHVESQPLTRHNPGSFHRLIVPNGEILYRQATQLDPKDSILL